MPDQKHDVRGSSPSRQILLAADKEELVGIIETLQADLQKRMEVEEEILHLNLQRGTASLQSQVEEASRRFKVAQQELEAFRLEILREEGDPAGKTPRPYIYEDLSAPPEEGPDRNTLRSLLASFRRLRDDRDRLKVEIERARTDKAHAEKAALEAARLVGVVAELEAAGARLKQDLDLAGAELQRLRDEVAREKPAPAAPPEELEALRNEVIHLQTERSLLWRERDDVRAEAERLRQGSPASPPPVSSQELNELQDEVAR